MQKFIFGLIIAGITGFFVTKWKLESDVEAGIDMAVLMASSFANVEYSGVSSTLTGELTVDDIVIEPYGYRDGISVDRFGIDTPSFLSLMKLGDIDPLSSSPGEILPEYFGIIIDGLRIPGNADFARQAQNEALEELGVNLQDDPAANCSVRYGMTNTAMQAMDYDEMVVSASVRFRELGERYSIELESETEDMYALKAELLLDGNMLTELAKGARFRPRVTRARVEYIDLSLNERSQDWCRKLGLSEEEAIEAQLDTFRYFGTANGIEFSDEVIATVRDFLEGKSSLVVTASPSSPVALSQINLYKPSDVPALLQLTFEAQ